MKYAKLNESEINFATNKLKQDWILIENRLSLEKKFPDFPTAFAFLTEVAALCEKLDHHPTITNTYGNVKLEIWTHDVGGLTLLDFTFAESVIELLDVRRDLF